MSTTMTANMNLVLPTPGSEPGPQYAQENNTAFTKIDGHDHTSGNGVPITPSGLSITADLSFLGNNATNLKSTRFSSQSSLPALAPNLGCVFVSGVDLYYNDLSGNQIRITQSGAVTGATGTITGLPSGTAGAAYSSISQSFIFSSATSVPAKLDSGDLIVRNLATPTNAVTISTPSSLAASYSLLLPTALPGSTKFVSLTSAGQLGVGPDVTGGISGTNLVSGITLPGSPTVQTNLTVNGTLTVSGANITLQSAVITPVSSSIGVNGIQLGGVGGAISTSNGANLLQIGNTSGGSLRPAIVHQPTPSAKAPAIVYGAVTNTGSISVGTGFTVSHPGTGTYNIQFNQAFSEIPSMVITQQTGATLLVTEASPISNSLVIVQLQLAGGGGVDAGFAFIAIGSIN